MKRIMHLRQKRSPGFLALKFVIGLGIFLTVSLTTSAQTDPMSAPDVQRGKTQFQKSCAMCHGAQATGGEGPNLLESPVVIQPKKYHNLLAKVIQDGRPEKGMPAFPTLSPTEISEITAFLNARVQVAESSGASNQDVLKRLLTGNADAGERYFNGQGKCSTCHSVTGDLAGIAQKYPPTELEARFLYPPGQSETATVTLSSGKKMKGTLEHLDAFIVAITDTDGSYHSWPVQAVKVEVENPLAGHLDLLQKYTDKDIHDIFSYLETLK